MKARDAAGEITRASKSNLALAFISLSGKRRRDITTFYAFCRVIDDIADDPARDPASKRRELASWRCWLRDESADEAALATSVRRLMSEYPITPEMLEEIITGVEMDVDVRRYATFEELRVYCYRVASAVGLVSIEIFGYKNPQCRDYAAQLGQALQMTNIIRDIATDLNADRIYLPAEDLAPAEPAADAASKYVIEEVGDHESPWVEVKLQQDDAPTRILPPPAEAAAEQTAEQSMPVLQREMKPNGKSYSRRSRRLRGSAGSRPRWQLCSWSLVAWTVPTPPMATATRPL